MVNQINLEEVDKNNDNDAESNQKKKNESRKLDVGGNRKLLKPDQNATGSHSVFKKDPSNGKVTHYETYRPQTNMHDPKPWESVKRYDGQGRGRTNKLLQKEIETPHIHDPQSPGGVRPPHDWEMPRY